MNKALILLLVTLVQSQSNGIVLSKDSFGESELEDWDTTDSTYPVDVITDDGPNPQKTYRKRLVTSDAFTRRSALDKNFMRFGRGGNTLRKHCGRGPSGGKFSFHRFGRGLKDNFIRFGIVGDNFIRFGRGGGKDGFMRFEKTLPEDFFRAGKSLRENFIRFGKADENFMRLGREDTDEYYQDFFSSEEPFQRVDKSSKAQDNSLPFGKSGKNGTNFLRFGKNNAKLDEADEINHDLDAPKEAKRKRRNVREKPLSKGSRSKEKSTRFFEMSPDNFPNRISQALEGSRQNLENLRNLRLAQYFPNHSNFPKSFVFTT